MTANPVTNGRPRSIRTEPHPDCPLCGGVGVVLYEGLEDRIFDVPGSWGFRRCLNPACRHVWLDPRPIMADLPLLYEKYYTHGPAAEAPLSPTGRSSPLKPLKRLFRLGYGLRFARALLPV